MKKLLTVLILVLAGLVGCGQPGPELVEGTPKTEKPVTEEPTQGSRKSLSDSGLQEEIDKALEEMVEELNKWSIEHGVRLWIVKESAEATNLRWHVIKSANDGLSRLELLRKWELIASLPKNKFTEEAKEMVALYKRLIKEDKKWIESTKQELEKMNPAEKVAYWMYKLRDADAEQIMQPGSCCAIARYSSYENATESYPPVELARLGWTAIPELIEHMGDPRPTRCMGYWRDFMPASFHLLSYGDCCQQIFGVITDIPIHELQKDNYGKTDKARALIIKLRAMKWWNENRDYLYWSDKDNRFVTDEEAKKADVPTEEYRQTHPWPKEENEDK